MIVLLIANLIKYIEQIFTGLGKHFQKVSIIFYLLYFGTLSGIIFFNVEYLNTFKILMHTFICLFLLFRFHPFREHTVSKYDARIIFASAVILLLNTGIVESVNAKLIEYKSMIKTNYALV